MAATIRAAVWPDDEKKVTAFWQNLPVGDGASLAQNYLPGEGTVLLAEQDGSIVGICGVSRLTLGDAEIAGLQIAPGVKGQGIEKMLVESAVEAAKNDGYLSLAIKGDFDDAAALGTSLGFTGGEGERLEKKL